MERGVGESVHEGLPWRLSYVVKELPTLNKLLFLPPLIYVIKTFRYQQVQLFDAQWLQIGHSFYVYCIKYFISSHLGKRKSM